jgi:hypothetical protein
VRNLETMAAQTSDMALLDCPKLLVMTGTGSALGCASMNWSLKLDGRRRIQRMKPVLLLWMASPALSGTDESRTNRSLPDALVKDRRVDPGSSCHHGGPHWA